MACRDHARGCGCLTPHHPSGGIRQFHPHQFRHSFAHAWLADGREEGDLVRLASWSSRDMLQRYGATAAVERAHDACRRGGSPVDHL